MSNPFFRDPKTRFPGSLTQVPTSTSRDLYTAVNRLNSTKMDTTTFPVDITDPLVTDILRFDGTNWVNASFIPGPFGVGAAEVTNQLLTLGPSASQTGLSVQGAVSQLGNLLSALNAAATQLFYLDPAGNMMVAGSLGVGIAPAHPFHVSLPKTEVWIHNEGNVPSSLRGMTFNKVDARDAQSHGMGFAVTGTVRWEIGQDFDTLGGGGNSDFVTCYEALSNADIMRFCPSNSNPYGQVLCSIGVNGTPRFGTTILFLRPVAYGLGGLGMAVSGGVGVDIVYDQTGSSTWDKAQIALRSGGTTANIFTERQISLAQIFNGSTSGTRNYLLLNGALSGTATTPLFNSTNALFGPTFGVEGTDISLSLFTAPVGNNQTPIYGLVMDTGGNLTVLNQLTAGSSTLNSLTVTGTTLLDGNLLVIGNSTLEGTLSAGSTTVNSLTVTGTVNVSGFLTGGQASFAATNLHSVVLTNSGIGGLKLAQASGTVKRVIINLNSLFQFGTDFSYNGGSDFWFQNISTGNAVLTVDVNDKITLGSTNSTGGAVLGVSSGKASFYGTSPASQPTITGSTSANVALQNLLAALATQGLIINSTT